MAAASTLPGFNDFDEIKHFEKLEEAVLKETTLNFAIEYDSDKAYAAVNIETETLQRFLAANRAPNASTRWISIFAPDQQPGFVKVRLIACCAWLSLILSCSKLRSTTIFPHALQALCVQNSTRQNQWAFRRRICASI